MLHRQSLWHTNFIHELVPATLVVCIYVHKVMMMQCTLRGVLSYVFQWKTEWLHWVCISRKRLLYVPYSGKFSRAQIFTNHQQTRQEKKFHDFNFCDKVTISDHTPYNLPHENGDPQRVFQRQNDSKTLAHFIKYQSASVAVDKELPCQREGANSKDLFAVAVMTGSYCRSRKNSSLLDA